MDKKQIQMGGLIAVIVLAVMVVGFFGMRSMGTEQGARTAEQSEVLAALEEVGNDPAKLSPEMRAKFDAMNAKNPFSTLDHYESKPNTPAASGGSGMPANYPTGN